MPRRSKTPPRERLRRRDALAAAEAARASKRATVRRRRQHPLTPRSKRHGKAGFRRNRDADRAAERAADDIRVAAEVARLRREEQEEGRRIAAEAAAAAAEAAAAAAETERKLQDEYERHRTRLHSVYNRNPPLSDRKYSKILHPTPRRPKKKKLYNSMILRF